MYNIIVTNFRVLRNHKNIFTTQNKEKSTSPFRSFQLSKERLPFHVDRKLRFTPSGVEFTRGIDIMGEPLLSELKLIARFNATPRHLPLS